MGARNRALGLLLLAAGLGCQAEPPAAPEKRAVASAALDLAFADLPAGFEVAGSEGGAIRLRWAAEDREGTARESTAREGAMWVEAGESSDFGIDLVKVTNSQKAIYEARPAGEYSGGRKMVTPAGQAYYSRGRFDEDGRRLEETRLFLIHPRANRLVTFHYLYPAADDSAERLPELFAWVGELIVEPAEPAATEP